MSEQVTGTAVAPTATPSEAHASRVQSQMSLIARGSASTVDIPGPILHVIVGGSPPAPGRTRYRRDRFADFLATQPTTAGVLVVNRTSSLHSGRSVRAPAGIPINYHPLWDYRKILAYGGSAQRRLFRPLLREVRQLQAATRILWYTMPMYAELADALEWDAVVYDCSDFWTGNRRYRNPLARWNAPRKARTEECILAASDLVIASSTFLAERIRSEFGRAPLLVENGVDLSLFRADGSHASPEVRELPRPRLGFTGTLKDLKIDLGLIADLAERHPAWTVLVIGPVDATTLKNPDYRRLHDLPNVTLLGARAPTEIPGLLQELDLGLLPYRNADFNLGVFPLKFFEYLATGLPVVGCGLPSTLAYVEDGVYRHVEGRVNEFGHACEAAFTWHAQRHRRVEIAERADWATKFATMLDGALNRVRRGPVRLSEPRFT